MRKMAYRVRIEDIYPIKGADRIVQYQVLGWKVIDTKGKYTIGDEAVYIEADAWVPHSLAPFLTKKSKPGMLEGIPGNKLRTIRLKGALSQGLLLNVPSEFYDMDLPWDYDLSELLGIVKWEPPPEFKSADAKGLFPSFIPKTDQPRVQNIMEDIRPTLADGIYDVEEKVEGTSFTAYFNQGAVGVCSRNLELKEEDNAYWNLARALKIPETLAKLGRNIAIQGEMYGAGISGNIYKLQDHHLAVFDIFDIDRQEYFDVPARDALCAELGLTPVAVLERGVRLPVAISVDELLDRATGQTVYGMIDTLREGLVYRLRGPKRFTWKTVCNTYLEGK